MRILLFIIYFSFLFFNYNCHGQKSTGDIEKKVNKNSYDIACVKEIDTIHKKFIECVFDLESYKYLCFDSSCFSSISPDGKKLILDKIHYKNGMIIDSLIIIDLNTMSGKKLNLDINLIGLYSIAWSPDNNYIAFTISKPLESLCQIGLIKSDNSGYRILDFNLKNRGELGTPTWSGDGKYIIIGDGNTIYKIGAFQYFTDTIISDSSIKDTCIFQIHGRKWLTNDNKYLIFDATVNNDIFNGVMPNLCQTIFAYDLENKELIRLTPKGMYAIEPYLGTDNDIYFTDYTDMKYNKYNIFKVNIISKKLTKVIDNAKNPSCRMQ